MNMEKEENESRSTANNDLQPSSSLADNTTVNQRNNFTKNTAEKSTSPQPCSSKNDKRRPRIDEVHNSIECISEYNPIIKTRRTSEDARAQHQDQDSNSSQATNEDSQPVARLPSAAAASDDGNLIESGDDGTSLDDTFCRNLDQEMSSPLEGNNDGEDDKLDPTPSVPRPQHVWKFPREILMREMGGIPGYKGSFGRRFIVRTYGSLHTVERFELMSKLEGHRGCVNALHFNETGTLLASGSDDLHCAIFQWQDQHQWARFDTGHRSNVFQVKFIRNTDDLKLVTAARDGQVRLAELTPAGTLSATKRVAYHKAPCHKLCLDPVCDNIVLSCGEDAHVLQLDLRIPNSHSLVSVSEANRRVPLYSVFIHPLIPSEFAVAGRDQYVRVYDRRFVSSDDQRAKFVKKFCPLHLVDVKYKPNISCAVYNHDGTEILATYNDEDIYIFDATTSGDVDATHRFRGHRNSQTVKGVNYFGLRSEYVISGSDCGYIYIWDKATGHVVNSFYGDEGGVVNVLEPNPVAPYLATSGLEDNIKIWAPSKDDPPDLSTLKRRLIQNLKQRNEESNDSGGDHQLFLYLMRHYQRSRRRRHFVRNLGGIGGEAPSGGDGSQQRQQQRAAAHDDDEGGLSSTDDDSSDTTSSSSSTSFVLARDDDDDGSDEDEDEDGPRRAIECPTS